MISVENKKYHYTLTQNLRISAAIATLDGTKIAFFLTFVK